MSIVTCPKCKSPNDDTLLDGGWLVCSICSNRWFPSAATIDGLPTAEIQQPRPPTPKIAIKPVTTPAAAGLMARTVSGEYLPDDPNTDSVSRPALTERVDGGRQSGMAPAIQQALADLPGGAPGHHSPPRPALPVGRPPPKASHNPETGRTIDSDLFDRLEEEARYKRSEMKTVPEIVFDDPAKYRTAVPHSDHSEKVACPVCGHSFPSQGTRHTCPQCGTAYDEDSQRIAAGAGSKDNLIGRNLRGCLIDRKLGEGGMGAVYHAKQLSLDRSVAVKVLPVDLARNKNFIQRFEREAKSLARINHPNILQIYDFGDDPQLGLYFMVIEFVEGLDLGEVLNRRGLLGQIEVLDLLRQAVAGLEAAAENNVIHRDIKPDNLMIGANGLVKVSDFGLAKGYVAQVGVTAAGVRVGTPAFMSPEQCDGADVDFRSDVYNLGATVFLCLTGRLPFDGETPFAIMLKHKTEPVPSLCDIDPTIDRKVDRLIRRMLAKKPGERCTSLRELHEDIEALESELAGTDSVLRKSRGPFKAMLAGAPPMQTAGDRASPHPITSVPVPLVDQVELVDLPPVPQIAPSVASNSGARRASSSGLRRGFDMPANIPPTPLEVAAAPAADKVGVRSSRRLDAELVQARERGRRTQLDNAIANGERLAQDGMGVEAAAEYQAAADLAGHDPVLQKDLRRRAASVRRRSGAARFVRRLLVLAALLAVAAGAVWLGTPRMHNWIASQRLTVLNDGLSSVPQLRQRVAALREFSASNRASWEWYRSAFKRDYEVLAAVEAAALADQMERQPVLTQTTPEQPAGQAAEIAAIAELAKDAAVPWETVAQRSGELLATARAQGRESPVYAPVIEAARTAEAQLAQQRTDLERIAAARTKGDHAEALRLSGAFRTSHPRAAVGVARLPLPARARIEVTALDLPADLVLNVDGVQVPLAPARPSATGAPAAEGVFCRNPDRETVIEVAAEGYAPVRQQLPASTATGERTVAVTLRPAPVWTVAYANPSATATLVPWSRIRPGGGSLLVQHRDGLLVLRAADGAVASRVERPTPTSSGFGILWQQLGAGRMLIARDDGTVEVMGSATLIAEQTLHRGKGEVLAWSDLDLALQNGKRIHAAIERTPTGALLIAQDATREYWRYAGLKVANQIPQILRHDDRLYVFDDTSLHLLEEDGTVVRVFSLPVPRIGAVVDLPQASPARRDLLIPCSNGIQRLQLGTHQDPVRAVADPLLAQLGGVQIAVDGDTMAASSDRQLSLVRFAPGGTALWRQDQQRPLGALPAIGAEHVVTVDDQGTLAVRMRNSGQLVQRIAHGVPLTGQPVVIDASSGALVIVGDRSGQIAAYRLRR